MEIFSTGKNIPTYSFGSLFVQGEKFADTITISLERFYNDKDVSEYSFMVVGLTEDGYEVNQFVLPESISDTHVKLKWNVSPDFTAHAGNLILELRAFESDGETMTTIIKYDMPKVTVKPTISGKNEPLPDSAEQIINDITVITGEYFGTLQDSVNGFNVWVQDKINSFNIDETNSRLDRIEADTATYLSRPEVVPVTRSQYNAMTHRNNVLYVITGEE